MIKKVCIVGMGALGMMYADQLTCNVNDVEVSFVMDKERKNRHQNDIYTINKEVKNFNIISSDEATTADLVMVCVKFPELREALLVMENCVGKETIILSAMNGISSERIIAEKFGEDKVIIAIAQGMDAMRDKTSLRYTKCGNLHIGGVDDSMRDRSKKVQELFEYTGLPHIVEENILYRMWFKYMLNVGTNQVCMVLDANYGEVTTKGTKAYDMCVAAMREVVEIANANKVDLTEQDLMNSLDVIRTLDPKGYPSMWQDFSVKKKSEVDMFAGEIIRQGEKFGIPTPVNSKIYNDVKKIEAGYERDKA